MSEKNENRKRKRSGASKSLNLVLRVCHVIAGSVLFGGLFWREPFTGLLLWHKLTILTGGVLIALSIVESKHWIYQGRGVMALGHVALVWLIHCYPGQMIPALLAVLGSGVVGSHLPGNIRHWSVVHRCRID